MYHSEYYLDLVAKTSQSLDPSSLTELATSLSKIRNRGGRVFVLGVGGSAANASHMVNDLRKLCHIESYSASDNVSELTARINDEGWDSCYQEWLKASNISSKDCIFVLSVGGGDLEHAVSVNIVNAIEYAISVGSAIYGIVSRSGGHLAKRADSCVVIPVLDSGLVTPVAEAFQAVVWHCIVSDPLLQLSKTKW